MARITSLEKKIEIMLQGEEFEDLDKIIKMKSRAIPTLVKLLKKKDSFIRTRSLIALGRIKSKISIPDILVQTKDANPVVRISAIQALSEIGDKKTISYITKALEDDDASVRKFAIKSLAKTKDPKTIVNISKIAKQDENKFIRNLARKTISQISS
jgi:HEAT repeat protein